MKHVNKWCIYLLLLPFITLIACNKDDDFVIWDISGVEAYIIIQNAEGQNLLTPDLPGSLYDTDISVEYNDEIYDAVWNRENLSRYYLAQFHGLTFNKGYSLIDDKVVDDPTKDYLSFGEFAGDTNQDLSFELKIKDYPDTYRVRIVHTFTWKKNEPKSDTRIYLNGERIEGRIIRITLPTTK